MEITVFAKERKNAQGKSFWGYLSRLTNKKTGEVETLSVRFRQAAGQPDPEKCPMNIKIEKGDANISESKFTREDTGEEAISKSLWVNNWSEGSKYIDHSMDDYF